MEHRNPQDERIGQRLKAARELAKLTQNDLAAGLGFEHRQTLASIENGERRLSAEELIRAVGVLGVDFDFFTDSFRLVGEGRFNFRAKAGIAPQVLDGFEERAGHWIATYRELGAQQGSSPEFLETRLGLSRRSTFEDAQAAAAAVIDRWQLGAVPASNLQSAIEQHLKALVLFVDAPPSISGAASQVPALNTILVNRHEPQGRRHFDLAHELFHLLTWDAMPPERLEASAILPPGKRSRVEQLADNFAAALLMPARETRARWEARDVGDALRPCLSRTAAVMRVSVDACQWRLFNLGLLSKADLLDISDQALVAPARVSETAIPSRFSEPFVSRIATALDRGRLSVKRAAGLLALSLADLAQLLRDYGFEPSFEA